MAFKKGQSGNPNGRPPGPNKLTTSIKAMIREALEAAGGAEYLTRQARENPTAFLTLVGKLVPAEVDIKADVNADVTNRTESVRQAVDWITGALGEGERTTH